MRVLRPSLAMRARLDRSSIFQSHYLIRAIRDTLLAGSQGRDSLEGWGSDASGAILNLLGEGPGGRLLRLPGDGPLPEALCRRPGPAAHSTDLGNAPLPHCTPPPHPEKLPHWGPRLRLCFGGRPSTGMTESKTQEGTGGAWDTTQSPPRPTRQGGISG